MINVLQQMAAETGHQISKKEIFGNFVIGMDEQAGMLWFFNQKLAVDSRKSVRLHEVKSCSIQRISSSGKNSVNELVHADEKLGLLFTMRDAKSSAVFFELYNADQSLRLAGELQLAQRWLDAINSQLKRPAAMYKTISHTPSMGSQQLSAV